MDTVNHSMLETAVDPNVPVSHEQDGRILTGVGVSADDLAETMDRHTPEPTDAPQPQPQTPAPAAPRDDAGKFAKQSRGQRRFDELTREREDARREASEARTAREAAERERDDLRARMSAPAASTPARSESAAIPAPGVAATRPKPTEDDLASGKYQTYGEYVEDVADWKAEQRLAALDLDAHVRKSIEADRASRTFADTVESTFTVGRGLYQDFDAVRSNGPGSRVDFSGTKLQAIFELPAEPRAKILYAIAKDAAVAQRLAGLSDARFGYELASFAPAPVATPASTPQGGSPVVPAPYQPVGSGSRTASIPSSALPAKSGFDFDKSGYREKRAAERAGRR